MSISPWSGARGLERLIWLLYGAETAKYIQFRTECCQKYALFQKKASNESCSKLNFVQKSPRARVSTPPPLLLPRFATIVYVSDITINYHNFRTKN